MSLEDRLERLAHRTPPGDPADVLAAARHRASAGQARPRRGARLLTAAAAIVAIVAIAGAAFALSGSDGNDAVTAVGPGGAESVRYDWGPLTVVDGGPSGDGALISGTLDIGADCVLLWGPDQEATLLVWPSQRTGWNAEANTVEYATDDGTAVLAHGDRVSFGGGGRSVREDGMAHDAWIDSVGRWVAEPHPSCPSDTQWFVGDLVSADAGDACEPGEGARPAARCGGVDGPVLFGPESHGGLMEQALLSGQLIREGDCLYLLQESEAGRYAPLPVVWPYGATWGDRPDGVRLADGSGVPVGALFEASGGVHDIDRLTELGHHPAVAERARACAPDGVGAVAYVQGDVTLTRPAPDRVTVPGSGASAQQLFDGTPVWVVRHDDRTVSVLDAVSTHRPFGAGTLVAWCPSSRGFVDPMYGSLYDEHGRKQAGPAPSGLASYPVFGVDANTVTVPGPATEQPLAQEGGETATDPAGPGCFEQSDGDTNSFIEGTYELHPVASVEPMSPDEAVRRPDGTVVVVDAPVVIVEGGEPTVCSSEPGGEVPSCPGVPARGLMLHDQPSVVLRGKFVARVDNGALAGIAYVGERSWE